MEIACLDLEGVLIPEIWIGFAEKTGIDALRATTRDIPDYDVLMRQRLALAGALLGQPEVLLLDEPANGLDPDGIRWLRGTLRTFADEGGTVFVSSHLIAELAMFADDLVVVGGGRLLAAEPVTTTMARGDTTVLVRTPDAAVLASLLDRADIAVHTTGPSLSAHGTTTDIVSQIVIRARRAVSRAIRNHSLSPT